MMSRRDFHRYGTLLLGKIFGIILMVPGIAYLLDPVLRKTKSETGDFQTLGRLSELTPGVPRSFSIIAARQDAWVKYPKEPVGSVWLIRQPDGQVVAFTAECPHLGCAVNLAPDAKTFLCPCHNSKFDFSGKPMNPTPPRGMDSLVVELTTADDPEIRGKFERFRTLSQEKTPLV